MDELTKEDNAFLEALVRQHGSASATVLPMLQDIHARYRYLPENIIKTLAQRTGISLAQWTGVMTFYPHFRLRPAGKHRIRLCHGTACHVKGAPVLQEALERLLKVPAGDDTDPDRRFTIEKAACLGCCTLAPVMQIDEVTYGRVTLDQLPGILDDFAKHPARRDGSHVGDASIPVGEGVEIRIGLGSCCQARGSAAVWAAFEQAIAKGGYSATLKRVGCVGMCSRTPLVEIALPGRASTLYVRVTASDAEGILQRHLIPPSSWRRCSGTARRWVDRFLTDGAAHLQAVPLSEDDPDGARQFREGQARLATESLPLNDPLAVSDYERSGGFEALKQCLERSSPQSIIGTIEESGLRGRGGAGYPTGRKWRMVHAQPAAEKVIILNGDEGDPGAFMDRMLLESCPYRVIEGLLIAAYAVGATEGVAYIRAEYPLAVKRFTEAVAECEKQGWIGRDIGGKPGFNFALRLIQGAGAFVCGEESAMLASIEGRRGTPHLRPPYPAERGLWGKPTLVNNVETLTLVPWIIRNGAPAFRQWGTANSPGTKVFALAGKVKHGGLIEVPMGITVRRVVEELGGGVQTGQIFKAVQIGGPSGGCLSAGMADIRVDYEDLTVAGAIMGSGGLVVLDDRDCMVDMARYFLEFTQDQSCGKCAFCRIGTRRMLEILERLCRGEGHSSDLDQLADLAEHVKRGSLCGLGKTAPNPVLTTLKYFREEYDAHLRGYCPAGRCRALIRFDIGEKCIGCTLCAQHCPVKAIPQAPYQRHRIDDATCVRCGVCRDICPEKAVVVQPLRIKEMADG